jgi:hypothetical protein
MWLRAVSRVMVRVPTPDIDTVLAALRDRGYETTRLPDSASPAAVATGGRAPGAVTDRPLSVVPLARAPPLSLIAALASAATERRAVVFVADSETAAATESVLADPFALRDETDGHRTFYSIPDRIRLTDGRFAAVRADADPVWREEPAAPGVTGEASADPTLVLEADGEVLIALESVDGLTCPGPDPSAVPYRYERGDDRRIHLSDRDREFGVYTGVARHGYRPVSLPLVPEHHLREHAHLARRWLIATPTDDGVAWTTP